jgi:hypothetical protein
MYSSLFSDTSKKNYWIKNCNLLNFCIDDMLFDVNDFTLARHCLYNRKLNVPPAREDYLQYLIFFKILENETLDFESLTKLFVFDFIIITTFLGAYFLFHLSYQYLDPMFLIFL